MGPADDHNQRRDRRRTDRVPVGLAAMLLFALATGLSYLAQDFNRPISAAILYLLGVLLIGALAGLRWGLGAAILASIIYNFFLSEPVLQFSLTSADEYIPLIAFNLSAVLSGALAGRLNDRARAAERATDRLNLLLEVSHKLQEAVRPDQLGDALTDTGGAEVFGVAENMIFATTAAPRWQVAAQDALRDGRFGAVADDLVAVPLRTDRGIVGILVHPSEAGGRSGSIDWSALAMLLTIAMERCLLFRERAEKQALIRSEEFKTALLSSVSHDLRTPLAAITAAATSLLSYENGLSPDDRRAMLGIIRQQSERLNRFTSNLLNLGRLQSEVGPGEIEKIDLADILGAAIAAVRAQAPDHAIEKRIAAPDAIIRGNPVMIEQIFVNVLENAVRYSPSGSMIRVALREADDRLVVSVSDEGRGIAEADLERVFDRFYRAPAADAVQGQGLGLSIARGFAERFGGTITAASPVHENGGTRVDIAFPSAGAEEALA